MSLIKQGLVFALALGVSGGGHLLSAQQGRGGGGQGLYGFGPRLGENVVFALELREDLGLTQDQVASLQTLQAGIQKDVGPLESQISDLRAEIQAGEVDYADGVTRLRDLFDAYQEAAAPYRTQVQAVLTPAQHQTLQGIMWETRASQGLGAGRAGMVSGRTPAGGTAGPLGLGRRAGIGRGAGLGLASGVGRGAGRGAGMGLGRGGGRGQGRGMARGGGRGFGICPWW
jgi:hypothetical protein